MNVDITSIILALITLLGGCGWLVDRHKHKQEIEGLKADNRQKNLDLGTDFVEKFRELIGQPLEDEVMKLRNEVNELRDAIREINNCPLSNDCPVRKRMQRSSKSELGSQKSEH